MKARFFVTATSTGVGKTFVTRGIARAFVDQCADTVALKPVETGFTDASISDAFALANASKQNPAQIAVDSAWYRAELPLSPYAVQLAGHAARLSHQPLIERIREYEEKADVVLVEGAGGIAVPLNESETFADFARDLGYPVILVAQDTLGVQSFVITAFETIQRNALRLAAVVLTRHRKEVEASQGHNAEIIRHFTKAAVCVFSYCANNDESLAREASTTLMPCLV